MTQTHLNADVDATEKKIDLEGDYKVIEEKNEEKNVLFSLFEMARDPSINAEKLEQLLKLQKDIMTIQREIEIDKKENQFNIAMANAQKDMKTVLANSTWENTCSYADKYSMLTQVNPVLLEHGLTISFDCKDVELGSYIGVCIIIRHVNGHVFKGSYISFPIFKKINNPKTSCESARIKGATTRAQRTLLEATFSLIIKSKDNHFDDYNVKGKNPDPSLLKIALNEAKGGMDSYEKWFVSLENADKISMRASGDHVEVKRKAREVDYYRSEEDKNSKPIQMLQHDHS